MDRADPDRIKKNVEFLSLNIGPRPIKKPEKLIKIRDFLERELSSLNYAVEFQEIIYKKRKYYNVIASSPKEHPLKPTNYELLVIGAHYDTVFTTPGADDNASGVAGLLEIARILSDDIPKGVRLVFFSMEEPPVYRTKNMASYHYAKYLKKNGQKLIGMICLEMIGYFSSSPKSQKYPFPLMDQIYPKIGNFIAMVGNIKSKEFTLKLKKSFSKYTDLPVESLNAPSIVIGIDFSDHWSFNKMGYLATMVTDTAFYRNPHYHKPTDLPSTLNYKNIAKVVSGLCGATIDLLT